MILYETDEQRKCQHLSWAKVEAIDEVYWRCNDCEVTADKPAPSNSKSEDTKYNNKPSNYTLEPESKISPEPPQDTSLDEYLIDLVDEHFPKGESKERGQANVMLAYFVMWHKAEVANLLQVIEDELVINAKPADNSEYSQGYADGHDCAAEDQRQALKKIKERLHE